MTVFRAAGLAAGLCMLGAGSVLAQAVPPELQGEYAIGSCTAPQVTVTIDASGLTVTDPTDGSVITSVAVQGSSTVGGDLQMDVLVDGDETGQMTLVDLGDGALNVIYAADNGDAEPPQRIELCEAATQTGPIDTGPTQTGGGLVPDILLGEFATGSCAAPDDRLVIGTDQMEAFSGSGASQGVAEVRAVTEIPDGYSIDVIIQGNAATLEMTLINQDIIEVAMIDDAGQRDDEVETLFRCTPLVVSEQTGPEETPETPPETPEAPAMDLAALPDQFLGEYAVGSSCEGADTMVHFEPNQLVVFENGSQSIVLEVTGASLPEGLIEPGIDFAINADGREGIVQMRSTGGTTYALNFLNTDSGEVEETETVTLCTPAVEETPETPEVPEVPVAATLPDAYLGEYALGESCENPDVTVVFEPDRLTVYENGQVEVEIDVLGVTATSPDLEFAASSEGQIGDVVMQSTGAGQYSVTFTDRETGDTDRPEIMTLCTPATTTTTPPPPGSNADLGAFLFDDPVARFGVLMDQLETVCQPGAEQQCLDTFWAFADVTGDGQLTQAELARVARFGTKWAVVNYLTLQSGGASAAPASPSLELGQILAVHAGTMVTGPLVADGLIYNHDYDGNGALSQVELFPDGVESAPIAVPVLMQLFTEDTLETLFDSLDELDRML